MVACLAHTMPLVTVTDAGIDVNHFPKRYYLYLTLPLNVSKSVKIPFTILSYLPGAACKTLPSLV